jgi:predicted HAD superfamily Cof-like phosphohydrolase
MTHHSDWPSHIKDMHEQFNTSGAVEKMDDSTLSNFFQFRVDCIEEEVAELYAAETAEDAVDALIDICVFAIGTLDAFKVDAHEAWGAVLEANMKKRVGFKEGRANPFGLPDLYKPKGWKPPSHADNVGLLSRVFDEDKLVDIDLEA